MEEKSPKIFTNSFGQAGEGDPPPKKKSGQPDRFSQFFFTPSLRVWKKEKKKNCGQRTDGQESEVVNKVIQIRNIFSLSILVLSETFRGPIYILQAHNMGHIGGRHPVPYLRTQMTKR